jgi:hypothetical protein
LYQQLVDIIAIVIGPSAKLSSQAAAKLVRLFLAFLGWVFTATAHTRSIK